MVRKLLPAALKDRIPVRWRRGSGKAFQASLLGQNLTIHECDAVSRLWYDKVWTLENRTEFAYFDQLEWSGTGTIFDIGAHQGVVAMLLRRRYAQNGRVIAVELDRRNAESIAKNAELNDESRISVLNAAIFDSVGEVRYSGRSNGKIVLESMFDRLNLKVKSLTIDWMLKEFGSPDLIYLDVEGAEVAALRGASNALKSVNRWFIEMHGDQACLQFGGRNEWIVNEMQDHGFNLFFSPEETEPLVPLRREILPHDRGFLLALRS